jgi:hypothetical protein
MYIVFDEKKTMCEHCLADFIYEEEDIYHVHTPDDEEEYEFYVNCPFCGFHNQLYDLEYEEENGREDEEVPW